MTPTLWRVGIVNASTKSAAWLVGAFIGARVANCRGKKEWSR